MNAFPSQLSERVNMEKFLRGLSKALTSALVCAVVLLAVLLAGVRLLGLTPYTVLSGSMEPAYHVGSVIYVKSVDPQTLKLKDPVTFYLTDKTIATHRIVEVIDAGTPQLSFRTKGDANDTIDGVIPASAVIGKPVFTVPCLGYVSVFLQSMPGLICLISSAAAVLALSIIVDTLFPKKKEPVPKPGGEETPG